MVLSLQAVRAERRGLPAEAAGAGAQGHGLGGPELSHQQHGSLRGSEATVPVRRAGRAGRAGVGWGGVLGDPRAVLGAHLRAGAQALSQGSGWGGWAGEHPSFVCSFTHSLPHSFITWIIQGGHCGERGAETRPVP